MSKRVAIVGHGYVGQAYNRMFPDAILYDEPKKIGTKKDVNECDMALVAVPTDMKEDGSCDTSIVEDVVSWIKSPLILIKSAVPPGTTDALVKKYKKDVCVSVETVGESQYFIPEWKYPHVNNPLHHNFLIIGGEKKAASQCADILWERMTPDINIHLMTALEAEVSKYMENTWGAMKVTFANEFYRMCEAFGADYKTVLQAVGDTWFSKMHMRVVAHKGGYKSKCFDKDIPAIIEHSKKAGYRPTLLEEIVKCNKRFFKE